MDIARVGSQERSVSPLSDAGSQAGSDAHPRMNRKTSIERWLFSDRADANEIESGGSNDELEADDKFGAADATQDASSILSSRRGSTITLHKRVDILDNDLSIAWPNCGKVCYLGDLPAFDDDGKTWVGVELDKPFGALGECPCDVRQLGEVPWPFFPLDRCQVAHGASPEKKKEALKSRFAKKPREVRTTRSLPPGNSSGRFTPPEKPKHDSPSQCKRE